MAHSPDPPDESGHSNSEAVAAARQAAETAKATLSEVETAAAAATDASARAEKAAEEIRSDKRFHRVTTLVEATISVLILAVLVFQGFKIAESIQLTRSEMKDTAATYEFGVKKDFEARSSAIRDLVYTNNSFFKDARDGSCTPVPALSDEEDLILKKTMHDFVSTYELYFDAIQLGLVSEETWRPVCLGAAELMSENCILKERWTEVWRERVSPAFRSSFVPNCNLTE